MNNFLHTPAHSFGEELRIHDILSFAKSVRQYPRFLHGAQVIQKIQQDYNDDVGDETLPQIREEPLERAVSTPTSTSHRGHKGHWNVASQPILPSIAHNSSISARWAATPSRTAACASPQSTRQMKVPAPTPMYGISEHQGKLSRSGVLFDTHSLFARAPQSGRHSFQHFPRTPSSTSTTEHQPTQQPSLQLQQQQQQYGPLSSTQRTRDIQSDDEDEQYTTTSRGMGNTMQQLRDLTLALRNVDSVDDTQWVQSSHHHIQHQSQSLPVPATTPHPCEGLYDITVDSDHSSVLQDIATLPVYTNPHSGADTSTTSSLHQARQR